MSRIPLEELRMANSLRTESLHVVCRNHNPLSELSRQCVWEGDDPREGLKMQALGPGSSHLLLTSSWDERCRACRMNEVRRKATKHCNLLLRACTLAKHVASYQDSRFALAFAANQYPIRRPARLYIALAKYRSPSFA